MVSLATVSVLRMRALIESAAFIARPTARALGIFEFARMLSFCRWVSVSRLTVWLDLSEPHAPMQQSETTRSMGFMAGNFNEPAYTCNPTWLSGDHMRRLKLAAVLLLFAACRPSVASRLSDGRWVDLTYPFDSTTIYWPTAQPFRLTVVSAQRTPGGYYYAAKRQRQETAQQTVQQASAGEAWLEPNGNPQPMFGAPPHRKLAQHVLPSERQYLALRGETDLFITLVRQLNAAALLVKAQDAPKHRHEFEEIRHAMQQTVERICEVAGKTNADLAAEG